MLLNNDEAEKRLSSPLNLINKLKSMNGSRKDAMSLFIKPKEEQRKDVISAAGTTSVESAITGDDASSKKHAIFNPFKSLPQPSQSSSEPILENILENHESQIKLGLAHDKALELLNRSVEMLSSKLDDVSASKLPAVISAASKTVESIRKERNEASKNSKDREVHYHFYTPQQNSLKDYEIIDVQ
jgi:hypothetical protein